MLLFSGTGRESSRSKMEIKADDAIYLLGRATVELEVIRSQMNALQEEIRRLNQALENSKIEKQPEQKPEE